jgi:hypothetical protein
MNSQARALVVATSTIRDVANSEAPFDVNLASALQVFPPIYWAAVKTHASSEEWLRSWLKTRRGGAFGSFFMECLREAEVRSVLDRVRSALDQAVMFDDETLTPLDVMFSLHMGVPSSAIHEASVWSAMSTLMSVLITSALEVLEDETKSPESLAAMVVYSLVYAISSNPPNDDLVEAGAAETAVVTVAEALAKSINSPYFAEASDSLREIIGPIVNAITQVAGQDLGSGSPGTPGSIVVDFRKERKRLLGRK